MTSPITYLTPSSLQDVEVLARAYMVAWDEGLDIETVRKALGFCFNLGQIRIVFVDENPYGFIAWIRCTMEHALEIGADPKSWPFLHWDQDELQRGPVAYGMEGMSLVPGLGYRMGRWFIRLPGLTHCAMWHHGKYHIRRVRNGREWKQF